MERVTSSGQSQAKALVEAELIEALHRHIATRSHPASMQEGAGWTSDYVDMLARILRSIGLDGAELAPLEDMAALADGRGYGEEPRAEDYARASAEITVLILTGTEEGLAARRVARGLIARGIALPEKGGDARGWKNLLIFRDRLRHRRAPEALIAVYEEELARLKSQAA